MTQAMTTGDRKPFSISMREMLAESGGKKFKPYPEGTHVLRVVDVIDRGWQEFKGKSTHQMSFVFIGRERIQEGSDKGKPLPVTFYCTTSLFGGGEGLNTSKHMKMLRGLTGYPRLTEDNLAAWDYNPEKLVGKVTRAVIVHKEGASGRVRADIVSFSKAAPEDGDKAFPLKAYTRPDWIHKTSVEGKAQTAAGSDAAVVFDVPGEAVDATPADDEPPETTIPGDDGASDWERGEKPFDEQVEQLRAEQEAERAAIQSEPPAELTADDAPF